MKQLDVFRDDTLTVAKAWREAAETAAKQFPGDIARYEYYDAQARRLEAQAKGAHDEIS